MIQKKILSCVFIIILLATAFILCFKSGLMAGDVTIEGTSFQDSYSINGKILTLRGYALLRYLKVVKAYTGAFYLVTGAPSEKFTDDVEKRLVLHYFQNISASDFAKATTDMIKKSLSAGEFNRLDSRLIKFNSLYRDVKPGDRYIATYTPGRGTELALNGMPLGNIPGMDFAAAFFSIWIGEKPIDTSFRDKLLGK
jgi:hypothetical protein